MARAAFGITLYAHDDRLNEASGLDLTFTAADLSGSWDPTENNLKTVNDAIVTRKNGSAAEYTQPTGSPYAPAGPGGVGTYNTSPTVNVQTDDVLAYRAARLVRIGTVDEDRH